jgi:hypothetical protein
MTSRGQRGEEGVDAVQCHTLRTDLGDGAAEAHEQAFQIVVAGFLDLAAVDPYRVQRDLLLGDQAVECKAERFDVGDQLVLALLEGHEYARLVEITRAAHDELHRQKGLSAAGGAPDERRSPARQPPARDLVKTANAGRALCDPGTCPLLSCFGLHECRLPPTNESARLNPVRRRHRHAAVAGGPRHGAFPTSQLPN